MHRAIAPVPETASAIRVLKFGGTSVGTTPQQIRAVARRVAGVRRAGYPVVVVVSARGSTTDELVADAHGLVRNPSAREMDQLLATGEIEAAALLALALNDMGVPAHSLSGAQAGFVASGPHRDGRIADVEGSRIRAALDDGTVVVVAGFQAIGPSGDVVTLGRGGSDTTAVALAAAVGAATCEIYTDVDGVYNADPRIVPDARLLTRIGSGVMAELAFSGARVLHPRAIELASRNDVSIHVRSTFTEKPGTTVIPDSIGGTMFESDQPVAGISHDFDTAHVVIRSNDGTRHDAELFSSLAEASVAVDALVRTGSHDSGHGWEFTVARENVGALRNVLTQLGYGADIHEPVAKVSLVGAGLLNHPETTGRLLTVLGEAGIEPYSVSISQTRTSVTLTKAQGQKAVGLLHHEFGLDRAEEMAEPASAV
ncbi:aspartate kinase [Streptomyces sp. NPDC002779]|uniref:aspartate kinase n=1 Tax=Streptomyces sp. NPDC002779 TaxID=3364664 RepID=UPI0036C1757F